MKIDHNILAFPSDVSCKYVCNAFCCQSTAELDDWENYLQASGKRKQLWILHEPTQVRCVYKFCTKSCRRIFFPPCLSVADELRVHWVVQNEVANKGKQRIRLLFVLDSSAMFSHSREISCNCNRSISSLLHVQCFMIAGLWNSVFVKSKINDADALFSSSWEM